MSGETLPEEIYKRADRLACDIVAEDGSPFLIVMERSKFDAMMKDPAAPLWVHLNHTKPFDCPFSGAYICGLPIRVEPDGSWKGKVIKPYALVMTKISAQVAFSGEYG